MTMVCAIHGYFLSLEEKLSTPTAGTTRRSSFTSADGITEKSSTDYVCYTIHRQDQYSQLNLAAVIVEAKSDSHYSSNAIAQLMGYYLRACTNEDGHTVAVLLTETKVHLLLFPFTKCGVSCVNAIWLSSVDFSLNNILGTINMLFLLAVITHKDYYCNIKLEERFCPITKDHTFMIRSEIEMMKDDLEQKLKEVEKEKEVIAMEKRVMAAEKEEIAGKCKAFEVAMKKLTPEDIAFYCQLGEKS